MPEGRRVAFEAGWRLADHVAEGTTATILHAPTARTRETAETLVRGLETSLRVQNKNAVRLSSRSEQAIRNFHFILDGKAYPPTDQMHPSLPASAGNNPFLTAFWQAKQDPIAYWLACPSENAESPSAVAERLGVFFISLLRASPAGAYILVTHSGPMRAFLRAVLGADPGEPDFCEWFRVDSGGVYYRGVTSSASPLHPSARRNLREDA